MTKLVFEKTYTVTVKVLADSSTLSEAELRKLVEPQVDNEVSRTFQCLDVRAGGLSDNGQTYSYNFSQKPGKRNGYQKTETRKKTKNLNTRLSLKGLQNVARLLKRA